MSSRVQTTSVAIGANIVLVKASAADAIGAERAAAVEAEPAEPEQAGAEQREGHVLRNDRLPRVILARAEHDGDDEMPRRRR